MPDEAFMRRALELAQNGRYAVSPNPRVGCVIVRNGRIIGEGWHRQAGAPHAEIEALSHCSENPAGADVFVNLEPCAHFGRTPPCADALIAAAPGRVVVAIQDPHPEVNGRGIEKLRSAGIRVELGPCADEAERLNEIFLWTSRTQSPFLLIKAGVSLDGKLATTTRQSRWITSAESRQASLALREEFDAILVGSGTVRDDDPALTRRLGLAGPATRFTRVVLDATGDLPPDAQVLSDGQSTLVFSASAPLSRPGVEFVALEAPAGRFDLKLVLDELWSRGIRSVIAEGGSQILTDIIRSRLWQKMVIFIAPMFIGGSEAPALFSGEGVGDLERALRFRFAESKLLGGDLMVAGYPLEGLSELDRPGAKAR
ncbi:MAG TPA: bifunctional diaminohydroxyphosphoribosylaminopyrimidine deaminase/5-amino-6-(5-phosphoribosylamino)uracil reductase RibD [Thermoanaerobaculia bacterium]|nr:bifunctional diaminohydroxyphosphoribosylaminopyrimidine deaminase/5-amino-6-(5-phosphoribosylamino)uracil reductase RibD [Thermoanaerobaculia bacterium]